MNQFFKNTKKASLVVFELIIVSVLLVACIVYGQILISRAGDSKNTTMQHTNTPNSLTDTSNSTTADEGEIASVKEKYELLESITATSSTSVEQKRLLLEDISRSRNSGTILTSQEKMEFLKSDNQ